MHKNDVLMWTLISLNLVLTYVSYRKRRNKPQPGTLTELRLGTDRK